jgi:hypothetical protein
VAEVWKLLQKNWHLQLFSLSYISLLPCSRAAIIVGTREMIRNAGKEKEIQRQKKRVIHIVFLSTTVVCSTLLFSQTRVRAAVNVKVLRRLFCLPVSNVSYKVLLLEKRKCSSFPNSTGPWINKRESSQAVGKRRRQAVYV